MRSDTNFRTILGSLNARQLAGSSAIGALPPHRKRRVVSHWFFGLLLLALGSMAARAACGTNTSTVIDLSTWSVVQYDVFIQPEAVWTLSDNNTVALQSVNADASILLSPFILQNDQIQGSWQVTTNEDDDFMGFVFGYQDTSHFYLFDWREFDQSNTTWGVSLQGMSVKVIHSDTPLTGEDLGATIPVDTNRVRLLYHNDLYWEHFASYEFSLVFSPGHFTIKVSEGGNVLATIVIDDATYASGKFGFYNFSQSMVRYAGFTRGDLANQPVLSVADSSVVEGDVGTTNLVFAIRLSMTNCEPVMVDYVITPGTATDGVDYITPVSGTIVFAPGETNKQVMVPVVGDTLDEENETFFITLSNAASGILGRLQAVGTIIDDDAPPLLRVDDVSVPEGDSGSTLATFTASLSAPSGRTIRVVYSTTDGTAVRGSDYAAVSPRTLTFLPGQTSASIVVTVYGDTVVEPDETFFLCLSEALHVTLPGRCAIGTILNDDGKHPPEVEILSPADGAVFSPPPGLIVIDADAWDLDGFVVQVDLFADGQLLGSVTDGVWTWLWTNNVPGDYVLTAVATDDDGLTGTSAPVHITIRYCDPALSATPLADQTRCLCDEVEFSTTVSSAEPVTFVWKANGVVLPGQTNRTLLLQSLKPSQAGIYTVEISTPCAMTSRSATLTLKGAGGENPATFSNGSQVSIPLSGTASPYPSAITVECVPGRVKHLSVTLDGLSHSSPDDIDILLVGPGGQAVTLMSDCGGFTTQKLTNVVLTFTDTATTPLPDSTRIFSGAYRPTNYGDGDAFIPPAPQAVPGSDFAPLLATDPNGMWSLFVVDDQGGDSGTIARGWSLAVEWEDIPPVLTSPVLLADGRFQTTLHGLAHMTHVVEASSDLATWVPISTNTLSAPAVLIFDARPGGEPYRFYRAIRCP